MDSPYKNIYKTARERAHRTQEVAAELLGVSVSSVSAYERDECKVPDAVVEVMMRVYECNQLGYDHLQATNPLVRRLYPAADESTLETAVIRICNRIRRLDVDGLLTIAEDGIISEQERPAFDEIVADLRELMQASLALGTIPGGTE